MARVKNTMDLVKKGEKCYDDKYKMTAKNAKEIIDYSEGQNYMIALNSFFFGYMQGVKATKAEMKRKGMIV